MVETPIAGGKGRESVRRNTSHVATTTDDSICYLNEAETRFVCEHLDPIEVIRRALILHGSDETVLPAEAYLGWRAADGASARSLSMPAMLLGPDRSAHAIGTKVINGSPGNVSRGLPRASGLTMLFDPLTARITTVTASQHLSALRTACVSVIAAPGTGDRRHRDRRRDRCRRHRPYPHRTHRAGVAEGHPRRAVRPRFPAAAPPSSSRSLTRCSSPVPT